MAVAWAGETVSVPVGNGNFDGIWVIVETIKVSSGSLSFKELEGVISMREDVSEVVETAVVDNSNVLVTGEDVLRNVDGDRIVVDSVLDTLKVVEIDDKVEVLLKIDVLVLENAVEVRLPDPFEALGVVVGISVVAVGDNC